MKEIDHLNTETIPIKELMRNLDVITRGILIDNMTPNIEITILILIGLITKKKVGMVCIGTIMKLATKSVNTTIKSGLKINFNDEIMTEARDP